jgi:hypothetical protein
MLSALLCALVCFCASSGVCAPFDERLWERYTQVTARPDMADGTLAAVYLEPMQLGDMTATPPFADFRLVTDRKEEVPWEIVVKRPEKREEEVPARMRNLSRTEKGETWLELLLQGQSPVNAVEIATPDTDFSRQIEVLGSADGRTWNSLRKAGVIFDLTMGENLRRTRVTFPQTTFRYLALRITNGDARPLAITGARALRQSETPGQRYRVTATIAKTEQDAVRQENSVVVRMATTFPVDRIEVATKERNFQRPLEVQIRRDGRWERRASGTIYRLDTPMVHESRLGLDIPEVAAEEFRLVFRNMDSPPLFRLRGLRRGLPQATRLPVAVRPENVPFLGQPRGEEAPL